MDTHFSDNNNYNTNESPSFIRRNLPFILVGALLLLIATVFLVLTFFAKNTTDPHPHTPDNINTTPTAVQPINFSITNTSPADNESDVYPGEISITFTTNTPLLSQEDYLFRMTPSPEETPIIQNEFPSQEISYGIVGNLSPDTTYTVGIYNTSSLLVHSWSFTTSSETPESSSRAVKLEQENAIRNFYPLFYDLPYETDTFKIDYTDRLTLEVIMYSGNQTNTAPAIESWIQDRGVDPATHTINYIQN